MSHSKKSDLHYSEETRIALLEQSIININETMKRFEQQFEKIDNRFEKLDSKIDSNLKWILGFIFVTSSGLLGVIAHGFHWI